MTLQITITSGNLNHDTELIGKMTPYVKVTGSSKNSFQTHVSQGNKPEWNQTLQCRQEEGQLLFQVYDKEKIKQDDLVGEGIFKFKEVTYKSEVIVTKFVQLMYNQSPAGTLLLHILYKQGLKFVGSSKPMNFDVSRVKQHRHKKKDIKYVNFQDVGEERAISESNRSVGSTRVKNGDLQDLEANKVPKPNGDNDVVVKGSVGFRDNSLSRNGTRIGQFQGTNDVKRKVVVEIIRISSHKKNMFSCLDGPEYFSGPFQLASTLQSHTTPTKYQ